MFFFYNFELSLWSWSQNDWSQCDIGDQPVTDKALYVLPPGIQSWRCFSCFFLLLLTRKGKDYTTRSSKLFFFEHQISYHYRLFCGRTSNIFIVGSEESFFSPPILLLTHHDHFFRSNRSSKATFINMHISWPHGDKKPLCTTWEIQIQHMGTTWYNLETTWHHLKTAWRTLRQQLGTTGTTL